MYNLDLPVKSLSAIIGFKWNKPGRTGAAFIKSADLLQPTILKTWETDINIGKLSKAIVREWKGGEEIGKHPLALQAGQHISNQWSLE